VLVVSTGRDRRAPAISEPENPTGIAVGVGAVAMVVAGVIALVVFGFAVASLDHVAVAIVSGIGALIFNGFLEDRFGQLAWHSGDLWRLLLLVTVGGTGLALGEGYRFAQDLRVRYRMAESIALSAPSIEEEKHGA
jgi:hypothetical protein